MRVCSALLNLHPIQEDPEINFISFVQNIWSKFFAHNGVEFCESLYGLILLRNET